MVLVELRNPGQGPDPPALTTVKRFLPALLAAVRRRRMVKMW